MSGKKKSDVGQNKSTAEKDKETSEEKTEDENIKKETQEDVIAGLEDNIKDLNKEISSLKDQQLRKQADFENFRKRMFREKDDAIRYANSYLLLDLIQIIDDFDRAIKSVEDSQDFNSFHSGIKLIEKQFTGMLENKYGLKRIESIGKEFDPEIHEAIAVDDDNSHDCQIVLEDYQKGYMLHDRILKHSKVKVSGIVQEKEEQLIENEENKTGENDG